MAGVGRSCEVTVSVGRDGAACRQGGQGTFEPDVERRRVDPPGQVAQLDDGLLGAAVGVVDQLREPGRGRAWSLVGQLLLGHAQAHGQRHQLGLGPVVQVALDPPQGRRGRVDRLGPCLLERADPDRHGIGRRAGPA